MNIDIKNKNSKIQQMFSPIKNKEEKKYSFSSRDKKDFFVSREKYSAPHPQEDKNVIFSWEGPEFETYSKSRNWYLVSFLFLFSIVVYALYTNSPIAAIVFILIGVMGYIHSNQKPKIFRFQITYDGILIGRELYSYENIQSFWIFYEPPNTKILSLHIKGSLLPYIHVPLGEEDPVQIRQILMRFVPEKKQEHSLVDVLERILRI